VGSSRHSSHREGQVVCTPLLLLRVHNGSEKSQRLTYHGHTLRVEEDTLVKGIIVGATSSSRSRGRPVRRWMHVAIRDWIGLKINNTAESARDGH